MIVQVISLPTIYDNGNFDNERLEIGNDFGLMASFFRNMDCLYIY